MSQFVDCQIMPVENPAAIEALNRSEIDIQIATAKRFPRSIQRFQDEAMSQATLNAETAASCFYTLKREGKPIMGESIRLAEIIGSSYENLRYGARVIEIGPTHLTAQGTCFDLEKNIAISVEVRRRITKRDGTRFSDDMIGVTANAATSIALRNAILRVVPRAHIKPIYDKAIQVAVGKAETLSARRSEAVKYFNGLGVTTDRVCAAVDKASVEDIGLVELAILKGIATALKEETTTIAESFPVTEKPKSRSASVADKLKRDFGDPTAPPDQRVEEAPGPDTPPGDEAPVPESGPAPEPSSPDSNEPPFNVLRGTVCGQVSAVEVNGKRYIKIPIDTEDGIITAHYPGAHKKGVQPNAVVTCMDPVKKGDIIVVSSVEPD